MRACARIRDNNAATSANNAHHVAGRMTVAAVLLVVAVTILTFEPIAGRTTTQDRSVPRDTVPTTD